jgi:hypothetical protein
MPAATVGEERLLRLEHVQASGVGSHDGYLILHDADLLK